MSCHVTSCHVMSRHVTSCHVMSRHVTSCHVMPRDVPHVTSWHVMSRHVISRNVTSCHITSCHVMSHLAPSCHVMSYHVTSYHFESRGTVTGPTLHCQLTSSTRNQFKLSMTVFVGCPEGCRYHTASAVYDLVITYYIVLYCVNCIVLPLLRKYCFIIFWLILLQDKIGIQSPWTLVYPQFQEIIWFYLDVANIIKTT